MNIKSTFSMLTLMSGLIFTHLAFSEPVWIDVRTVNENKADNIAGDPLIPYQQIVEEVSLLYPDKDTEINLYCRSGNRAGIALSALNAAGYTHVQNFGSIGNARKVRAATD
ncbi:rhodanese-like domain-containing protein [Psychromonas sp.]|nr:rhodanese-like domain-containing protein [Psychromonas sp.]